MELPLTRDALPLVNWVDSAESTNAMLRELAADAELAGRPLPHGALLATANQTAGRGRLGRGWETPPNTAVAASLLVRPQVLPAAGAVPAHRPTQEHAPQQGLAQQPLGLSWLPLLAGSAVARALQALFRGEDQSLKRVGVKWPNDVHVRDEDDAMAGRPGAKLCGILCEVLPGGEVIVGFGVNLLQEDWQLPTERAGSVLACGGDVLGAVTLADPRGNALVDRVLSDATGALLELVDLAASNAASARTRVLRDSLTLGAEVRVHLPGGELVDGRAVGLADDGSLIVDRPTTGQLIVSAADVEHLR